MKFIKKENIWIYILVFYKLISGFFEIFVSMFIFIYRFILNFVSSELIIKWLTYKELLEDPSDIIANWLLAQNPISSFDPSLSLVFLLFVLGLVKIVIAFSLILRSHKIRIFTIYIFSVLIIFAIWDLIYNFSILKSIFLALDIYVLYYLVFILPKHLKNKIV